MKIKGTVRHVDLGTGFWGIESFDGDKYMPVNMPEQLKTEGRHVEVNAEAVDEMAGLHQWGRIVKITSFET